MNYLIEFLLSHPKRLESLGKGLAYLAWALGLSALLGWFAKHATSLASLHSAQTPVIPQLRDLYPGLPTWWVPESSMALIAISLTGLVGFICIRAASQVQRLYRY